MIRKFKYLTTLTALIFTAYIFAGETDRNLDGDVIGGDFGGPKQSWEEIFENPRLKPHFPAFVIQGHLIDYNFLCIDREYDVVRTKYQVKITLNDKEDSTVFDYLFETPVGEHFVCSNERRSCFYETIPLSQGIYVYRFTSQYNSGSRTVLFRKDYKLPYCK